VNERIQLILDIYADNGYEEGGYRWSGWRADMIASGFSEAQVEAIESLHDGPDYDGYRVIYQTSWVREVERIFNV